MRMTKILLICLCCLVAASAAWGQGASQTQPGILGYLDPQTGAFRAVALPTEETGEPPALTIFTGTVTVKITVTVKSSGISNVSCSATVAVQDAVATGSPRLFNETNTVAATGSGGTRTCSLSIPYSWALATQSSDMMSTSYIVSGAGSSAGALPLRNSSLTPLDTRKVPSSGTTTALTAAVTI